MDEWETLIEFPDYVVNRAGKIANRHTHHIIEPSSDGRRSIKLNLRKDGKVCTRSVGRLVCRQFHGEPEYGDTVIFIDNDPCNVAADNLEWGTRSFAWEWTHQAERTEPRDKRRVERIATGEIYENTLEAAKAVRGIEKYIVLAAGHPDSWFYRHSHWRWV